MIIVISGHVVHSVYIYEVIKKRKEKNGKNTFFFPGCVRVYVRVYVVCIYVRVFFFFFGYLFNKAVKAP